MTWEYREHTADLRVAFTTSTLEELFTDAVLLVRELVAGSGAEARHSQESPVRFEVESPPELLLAFLRELLFLFETKQFVPASLEIRQLDETRLEATVGGEPFDPDGHQPQPEVKAVTRHGLEVTRSGSGWRAEVVVDV